jgi:hypothetical protein
MGMVIPDYKCRALRSTREAQRSLREAKNALCALWFVVDIETCIKMVSNVRFEKKPASKFIKGTEIFSAEE